MKGQTKAISEAHVRSYAIVVTVRSHWMAISQGEVFSMQEMQQLKESFKVADKDRVGYLDAKQFKKSLIGLGLTATNHELDQLLVDLGCDPVNFPFAKITFDKFAQYLCLMRAE